MQQGIQVLDTPPGRVRTPLMTSWMVLALVVVAAGVATAGLVAVVARGSRRRAASCRGPRAGQAAPPLTGSPAIASASEARALLTAAPSVVVASTASRADVVTAAAIAAARTRRCCCMPAPSQAAQAATGGGRLRADDHGDGSGRAGRRRRSRALAADLAGIRLVSSASACR